MKLLEIQASVRQEGSVSRTLASKFIYQWHSYNPDTQYNLRDVGVNSPADLRTTCLLDSHQTID